MLQPRIEAEIAFVLGKDIIAAESTPIDIIAATAYILPALEIVDSRIRGWDITIADTVADNASSGFFVLGLERTDVRALDLQTCEMLLEVDGREASRGLGSACLGHPLNAVRWLANTLVQFGEPLRAGANRVFVRVHNRSGVVLSAEVDLYFAPLDTPWSWPTQAIASGVAVADIPPRGFGWSPEIPWTPPAAGPHLLVAAVRHPDLSDPSLADPAVHDLQSFWTWFLGPVGLHRVAMRAVRFAS